MALFGRIERISRRYTRIIGLIGLAGLLVLSFATVMDVLLRWLFNKPMVGLTDTYSLLIAVIIASCFPLCNSEREAGHITMRFLGRALGRFFNALLEAFGSVVTLLYFGLIAWQIWAYAEQLKELGEVTWVLSWPLSPWWRVVSILFFLSIPPTILAIIKFVRSAGQKKAADSDSSKIEENAEGVS